MLDAKRFASVQASPVGVLGYSVDATDTIAIFDLNLDETIVTPVFAPGVLDDPVGDALCLKASCCCVVAAVPPLIDIAVRWTRSGIWGGVITVVAVVVIVVTAIIFTAQIVPDNCNSVI